LRLLEQVYFQLAGQFPPARDYFCAQLSGKPGSGYWQQPATPETRLETLLLAGGLFSKDAISWIPLLISAPAQLPQLAFPGKLIRLDRSFGQKKPTCPFLGS
jgi:hypothetical protein